MCRPQICLKGLEHTVDSTLTASYVWGHAREGSIYATNLSVGVASSGLLQLLELLPLDM